MTTSDVINVLQLVNIVLTVIFIAIIAIKFFVGFKRGLFKSLLNGVALILAIVAGFFALSFARNILNPKITEILADEITKAENLGDLVLLTNTLELAVTVIEGLIGPIVFLVLFFCFKIIFGLIAKIIGFVLKIIPIKGNLITRLGGAVISVLIGIGVFFITLMPVAGYINVVPSCYETLEKTFFEDDDDEVGDMITAVCDEGIFMGDFIYTVTSPIFNLSTTAKSQSGVSVKAFSELTSALISIGDVTSLEGTDTDDIEAIVNEICDIFDKTESYLVKTLMVEVVSVGGEKWLQGESFIGINLKEEVEQSYGVDGSVLDGVLQKFTAVTDENFVQTLNELSSAIKSLTKLASLVDDAGNMTTYQDIEDFKSNLADTLKEIDSSTVDILVPAISSDLLTESGLSEAESELVSKILTNTLTSVVEMTDEEIEQEAEAIGTLLSYVSSPEIVQDADEVLDALLSSDIILPSVQTVINNSDEDVKQLLTNVTDEDKENIGKAIEDYKAENPDADEDKLAIIKSLFGIE